jgi:nicotinate-nucleotide pyrophosphorylase (carboxylating)
VGSLAEQLLAGVTGRHLAHVTATEPGLLAGLGFVDVRSAPAPAGTWRVRVADGESVSAGQVLIEVEGTASELAVAEDYVLGPLGFASGIATRARTFRQACPDGLRIACGGWKKLPVALKPLLRAGLAAAGVLPRLVEGDFIYVNKNAVRLLGNVTDAIAAGRALGHGPVAVQVRSVEEGLFSARAGAGIIMVDTARLQDLADVHQSLTAAGLRDGVVLAFGGGVRLEDLPAAHAAGAQAVDVGRAILDAPLLDLRMEVVA